MSYEHTQKSLLGWLFIAIGGLIIILTWLISHQTAPILISIGVAIALIFAGLCFGSLTVRDEGRCLAVRFGPLPVFMTRIAYSAITGVKAARSDVLDGWGIHWLPRRGCIYNVWGFDCARIRLGNKTIRVGTNDIEGLVCFLETKIQSSN